MAIKFADTYFNYGDTVRSAPIPGPTRGRETSASGLAEGLGRGCRLIVDAHLFFFFSFSLFCFYMHVLVPKIYPTCIENLAVWVCIVMYLVHSYIRSRYIRSTSYFRLFSIRTMAILYIMYYIHVMVLIT